MQKTVRQLIQSTQLLIAALAASVLLLFIAFWIVISKPAFLNSPPSENESTWSVPDINTDLPEGAHGKKIKFGYLLVSETPKWIGPAARSVELRFAGNNLTCKNCHLESGTKPGAGSFIGVPNRFPQYRGREGKMGTIEERINGCMERSMNGIKLPEDSPQMEAFIAYMEWLSEDAPPELEKMYKGFPQLTAIPEGRADVNLGKEIYLRECITCHMEDGQGQRLPGMDSVKGYLYPPVWGKDSYNHGAGMYRVITAAEFIKSNMPFGEAPKLTDEEAFHVAAYIDSFDRPLKPSTDADFPDKKLKPVSTPYGPWEDPFSPEQHKFGPFPPIIKYYEEQFGITKTK